MEQNKQKPKTYRVNYTFNIQS